MYRYIYIYIEIYNIYVYIHHYNTTCYNNIHMYHTDLSQRGELLEGQALRALDPLHVHHLDGLTSIASYRNVCLYMI